MRRWIFIVLGILIAVTALAGIYVYLAVSRPAAAGPFLRTANPQILFGGGESLVTLSENLDGLPTCTAQQRSADIVLVTDISGSMAGGAFDQARAAMENFIRDLDLTVNQVAVVYFAGDAVLVQGLTSNSSQLQNALNGSASQGGTSIAAGLSVAGQALAGPRRRAAAIPVIVLLSDGGAQDPLETTNVAQQLKDAGVRIVTIALPGRDLDTQFMRELASQPSDAYQTPSTAELADLYRSLAVQINSGRAFNARLQENLNLDRVQLVSNSLIPAGTVENGNPTWQIGVLTTVTPTFQYRVQTNQLGLVELNNTAGQGSLVDCAGLAQSWILPAGPTLLVLPPAWCFLIPLLLLPLFLFGLFRRRNPIAPSRIESPVGEPDIPAIQETPAWVRRLGDTRLALATDTLPLEADDGDLHNTLIIGIGPAGREVTSQVAQKLRSRFGGKIPPKVRLLQIDTQLAGTPGEPPPIPVGLEQHQRVLLLPNLQEVEHNLRVDPQNWQHWKWYENTGPTYERARGRAGLFYDLRNGSQNSELWTHLREQLHNFSSPRVRIVGTTFDDTSSGILVDVARLVQIVAAGGVFVEYFLAGAMGVDWTERLNDRRQRLRPAEQRARSLATVRELERFESNVEVPLVYVPPTNRQAELRASSKGIVQTLYLFEPRPPNAKPEADVLVCMADTLLALLHQETNAAVNEHLQARRADAGSKINAESIGMASSLGCFSFQLPGEPLTQAMAWRMVRDTLFDEHVGLVPRERTTTTGDYEPLPEDEWIVVTSNDRASYRNEAELLVERHATSYGLESKAFTRAVALRAMDLLNGESDAGTEPVIARRGGLARARAWVEITRGFVTQRAERNSARRLTALIQELEAWETWLVEQMYPASQARWRESREQLAQLREQTGRNWLLDETLEWPAYKDQIRPNPNLPPESPNDYFISVGRRFGWDLAYQADGTWRLQLVVPPADWVWQERSSIDAFTFSQRDDTRPILQDLYALAFPFVRGSDKTSLLIRRAERYVPAEWFKHAQPRLAFDQLAASNVMGSVRQISLLLTPGGLPTQMMESNLENASAAAAEASVTFTTRQVTEAAPRSPTFRVLHTNDQTSITLLRVVDWIPLPVAAAFSNEQWESNPVLPTMYVWNAEQEAARLEEKGRDLYAEIRANNQPDPYAPPDSAPQPSIKGELLSPRFVSWLGQDERLIKLFGQAYLYQLLTEKEEGLELPGVGIVEGNSFGALLENLVEYPNEKLQTQQRQETLAELDAAIKATRKQIADDPNLGVSAYLRQTMETQVTPLLMGKDTRAQDFARYLLGLIADET